MEDKIIKKLFKLANKSLMENDFPVAAIIFKDNEIISCGYNKRNTSNITTDHAEIVAIKNANKKINNWNLQGLKMIVTLEPCDMCKSVIREARLDKVFYLVPRYKYKKQYKCTVFEKYSVSSRDLLDYEEKIKNFFKDKR